MLFVCATTKPQIEIYFGFYETVFFSCSPKFHDFLINCKSKQLFHTIVYQGKIKFLPFITLAFANLSLFACCIYEFNSKFHPSCIFSD